MFHAVNRLSRAIIYGESLHICFTVITFLLPSVLLQNKLVQYLLDNTNCWQLLYVSVKVDSFIQWIQVYNCNDLNLFRFPFAECHSRIFDAQQGKNMKFWIMPNLSASAILNSNVWIIPRGKGDWSSQIDLTVHTSRVWSDFQLSLDEWLRRFSTVLDDWSSHANDQKHFLCSYNDKQLKQKILPCNTFEEMWELQSFISVKRLKEIHDTNWLWWILHFDPFSKSLHSTPELILTFPLTGQPAKTLRKPDCS